MASIKDHSFTISLVSRSGSHTAGSSKMADRLSSGQGTDSKAEAASAARPHDRLSESYLLREIQSKVNAFESTHTQLEFIEHEGTKRMMVKVVNAESGEVIREVPPEQNLDLLHQLLEMAGIIVDEKR